MTCRAWTESDDAILARRYPHEDTRQLAIALKRSYSAVNYRACRLRLTKSPEFEQKHTNTPWTDHEDHYLLTHSRPPYRYTMKQIAADLGRSYDGVQYRIKKLRREQARQRRAPEPMQGEQTWMIEELAAHLTRRDIPVDVLETVKANLKRLRGMPQTYWRGRAEKPLIEWFREVGAA